MTQNKKPYGTVLIKAVQILDFLSQRTDPQSMTDISKNTDLTLSTTNKILDTLEMVGFVTRDTQTKFYSLGPRLIQLANASFIQFDVVRETYPALRRLYENVGTTVNLGMYHDGQILFVNKFAEQGSSVETLSRIGFTQQVYCSAMGKSVLAAFSPEEREKYLAEIELTPNTEYTITDKEELLEQIEEIRERGYAFDDREAEDNIFCVGTTFEIPNDPNYYAFSISAAYDTLTEETLQTYISELIKTKNVIEYQLSNFHMINHFD